MFKNSSLLFPSSAFINLYFTISSTLIPKIIWAHFYSLGFYKLNSQNIIFKSRNQLWERIWIICLFKSGCPHSSYLFLFHPFTCRFDLLQWSMLLQWLIIHCLSIPHFVIYSSFLWNIGWFHIPAAVNRDAMNMCMWGSL